MDIKEDIELMLHSSDWKDAFALISEYEQIAPMDKDLITYKIQYALQEGNMEEALQCALRGVEQYPTSGDMNYNLACIYEKTGDFIRAYEYYDKSILLYDFSKDDKWKTLNINDIIDKLIVDIQKLAETASYEDSIRIKSLFERMKTNFGLKVLDFRSDKDIIGQYCWVSEKEKLYVGAYRPHTAYFIEDKDLYRQGGEFRKVTEGYNYRVEGKADYYLLPVASEKENVELVFKPQEEPMVTINQWIKEHFNHYKVPNHTLVYADGKCFFGKPIPLEHSPKRKKLVLNLFVDGLSQEILNGKEFEQLMPNTYRFFRKGTICTQAYSSAEWTYPSIANYVTGLDTAHHMMFHSTIDGKLPEGVTTLAEYFQQAGYFTSMFDGDWRIIPPYGHARGYDQYIYQHEWTKYNVQAVVGDALEHLEAFSDTDQFLWLSIGDLHDIADGIDLTVGVQTKLDLQDRAAEEKGVTSVKQSHSKGKIQRYKKTVSYIDVILDSLYHHIEERYDENEILVGLFADHGQGYLISEGSHFLSEGRTKVAYMFRGDKADRGICDELISSSDYISIMCKLAGIQMQPEATQSNLPVVFGGNYAREYVLTESLHPNDPYYLAIFTRDNIYYFSNGAPTNDEGRFYLKDYTFQALTREGDMVTDQDLLTKYISITLQHIEKYVIYE